MAGGPKIKASAARVHTRNKSGGVANRGGAGSLGRGLIALIIFSATFAFVSWIAYQHIQPPPPTIAGTPGGPPIDAPRVQLRDGRYLAYKESGVPKKDAEFKIVAIHGYGASRLAMLGSLSEEVMSELKIYVVGFDRAGYGESTPNPGRNIESDVLDVQDLADGLDLGPTFYVAATSIGGYTAWGMIKYIPQRLAGVAMFAPVVNFFWKGLPPAKCSAVFETQRIGDRLALRVTHYAPGLLHWYMTQTWFPTSSTVAMEKIVPEHVSGTFRNYLEALKYAIQQGKDESQFRDMKNMFGTWEFEPFGLENPFATRKGAVHIWQGDKDYLVPEPLQREVAGALPWVKYHEVKGAEHVLLGIPGQADKMIRTLCQK